MAAAESTLQKTVTMHTSLFTLYPLFCIQQRAFTDSLSRSRGVFPRQKQIPEHTAFAKYQRLALTMYELSISNAFALRQSWVYAHG